MTNKIGRWQGAGLLTTTLLGTSVFILPQMTVDIAGEWAVWAWAILTVTILPVALVFAKLSAAYPHSAGPAHFVEQAFGSTYGRTIGMSFLFVVPIGAPAALMMTYQFVEVMFQTSGISALLIQLSFLLVIFLLNYRGIQISAVMQLTLTLVITAIVILMLVVSGYLEPYSAQTPSNHQFSTAFTAAGLAFWSFLGIEAMSHLANDFKDPKRDLIPAIFIGTILVGLIYIGCTYLMFHYAEAGSFAMVSVFDQLFGGHGAIIIGILGIAGGLATVNVYTASLTRLATSFADDGFLPRYFAKTNRHGISVRSLGTLLTVMAVVISATFVLQFDLEQLVGWVNGVFVIIYFASMLAALKLLDNKYTPFVLAGCGFCLMLVWGLGWQMSYALILLVVLVPFVKRKQMRLNSSPAIL